MWLPRPNLAGIDLTSSVIQECAFAIGAALFALADTSRPRFLRRRANSQAAIAYLPLRFKRHLLRVTAMLIAFAVILEIGQYFESHRRFSVFELGENTLSILGASAVVYGLARFVLRNRYLTRITERHLDRVADAFRAEALYSAHLRDVIQAGRAICIAPSIDPADKIDQVGRLLDQALGVEMPNPPEELRDTVFGPRTAAPATFQPVAEGT
jgi:hypothetical protein